MTYLRNNSGPGIWLGQNKSSLKLPTVTGVSNHNIDGTVTITLDSYTKSLAEYDFDGATNAIETGRRVMILSADEDFDVGFTLAAPVGSGTMVAQSLSSSASDREFHIFTQVNGGNSNSGAILQFVIVVGGVLVDTGISASAGAWEFKIVNIPFSNTCTYTVFKDGILATDAASTSTLGPSHSFTHDNDRESSATFTIAARHDNSNGAYAYRYPGVIKNVYVNPTVASSFQPVYFAINDNSATITDSQGGQSATLLNNIPGNWEVFTTVSVNYAGRTYTNVNEIDDNTIQATVPHDGLVNVVDNITVTDSVTVSPGFATVLEPPVGYSYIEFSVPEPDIPESGVFYNSDIPFIAGDQFLYPTLSSNTSEALVMNSQSVPTQFLSAATHNYEDSWFVDQTDQAASSSETLAVVVVDNTVDFFHFDDVTNANPGQTYQDIKPISGPPDGALIYVTGGDISNDAGSSYTTMPAPFVDGQTYVRATATAGPQNGDTVTTSVSVNNVSSNFRVITGVGDSVTSVSFDPVFSADINDSDIESSGTVISLGGPFDVSVENSNNAEYRINGGAWTSSETIDGFNSGDSIEVRLDTGPNYSTAYTADVQIGGIVGTYTVFTRNDPAAGSAKKNNRNSIRLGLGL